MTRKKQSFDQGTNGATLTAGSGGNTAGTGINYFETVNIGGTSAMIFDTSQFMHGTQSCKMTPGSGEVTNLRWTSLNSTQVAMSFYIRFSALPVADFFLANFIAGGTTVARLMFSSSTGKLRLTDTRGLGAPVWTSAAALSVNTWYRIELYITINASAATETVAYYLGDSASAVDGTSINTGQTGSTAVDTAVFGKTDTSTYTTAHWYDSIQVEDAATGLIGAWPTTVSSTVRPTSVTSNPGGWTNQGGAADMAAATADELDSTYAQSPANPTSAALTLKVGNLDVGLPTVAVRNQATSASPPTTLLIELLENTTTRSSRTVNPVSTTWTDTTWQLTPGRRFLVLPSPWSPPAAARWSLSRPPATSPESPWCSSIRCRTPRRTRCR
jgi:hypothetical protein